MRGLDGDKKKADEGGHGSRKNINISDEDQDDQGLQPEWTQSGLGRSGRGLVGSRRGDGGRDEQVDGKRGSGSILIHFDFDFDGSARSIFHRQTADRAALAARPTHGRNLASAMEYQPN
jgi:hypothetical protein